MNNGEIIVKLLIVIRIDKRIKAQSIINEKVKLIR